VGLRGLPGWQNADDLVSETFVVAWRRFGDIPDPALPEKDREVLILTAWQELTPQSRPGWRSPSA
jgi:hypothetical protein